MPDALDVKEYVMDSIENTLTNTSVKWGYWSQADDNTTVTVGDLEWQDSDHDGMGNRRRKEVFTIEIIIVVKKPGGDNIDAERAAMEIYRTLETAFRNDMALGGNVNWCLLKPGRVGSQPYSDGAESLMISTLNCMSNRM